MEMIFYSLYVGNNSPCWLLVPAKEFQLDGAKLLSIYSMPKDLQLFGTGEATLPSPSQAEYKHKRALIKRKG